jgi:putative tributyrin esterase
VKHHRVVRLGVLAGAVLVALAGGTALVLAATRDRSSRSPGQFAQAGHSPGRTLSIACRSSSLGGQLPAQVYLPPGYRTLGPAYRVIYFLHGLPGSPQSYTQNAFVAHSLLVAHEHAIVVAPQGARSTDEDREYLDWSPDEDWPSAISHDLTACIDHRFHTIARRTGRALIGLSAGGYGAFNIGLRNLQSFGAVESWSGYFLATDPSGRHVLNLGSPQAQRAGTVPNGAGLAAELARWPSLIAFYVGTSDERFLDMNQAFDAALRHHDIRHVFRTYPGGHSGALWQAQAPAWLSMALRYLATSHASNAGSPG